MALTLTNAQYDALMRDYQYRRDAAESLARENRTLAYNTIPALKELDLSLVDLTRKQDSDSRIRLRKYVEEVSAKRRSLLVNAGFPEDFLIPKYTCTDCKDTGFVNNEPCHCYKSNVIKLIYSKKRWQDTFNSDNFENFDISFYNDSDEAMDLAKVAYNKSKEFANSIINKTPNGIRNLIITGNTGVGKTFLCNCILKELVEHDFYVVFLSATTLFEIFEIATFNNNADLSREKFSPEARAVPFNNIFECDLLIIDDLGTEFSNSFTSSKLLELVNRRLTSGLPTLISTNMDLKEISRQYTERLLSRIVGDYNLIRLVGDDIRLKKRQRQS